MLSEEQKKQAMDLQLDIYNCKIKARRLLALVNIEDSLIIGCVLERLENALIDLDAKLGDQNAARTSVSS